MKGSARSVRDEALTFPNRLSPIPQARTAFRTALFVTQVLPLPVKPQQWLSREPERTAHSFPLTTEAGAADVYRIVDGRRRPGVLVFLGINPAPRDDSRVVNLGKALARAGFVAMFPWSPSMIGERIAPTEPDNLVRAFQYLRGLEYVDPHRVGMGGFCVGASMVMIAASDERITGEVNFVSSFGAYYDMADMVKQIASNRSFYGDGVDPWAPNHLTERVCTIQLIEGLSQVHERELLTRLFVEKGTIDGLDLDQLSTECKSVYHLLRPQIGEPDDVPTLEEADSLVRALPPKVMEGLKKLSPSASIGNLKARFLIAHDREDDCVPSEESRRLVDAISNRGNFHYTEFSFFSHVTPNKRVGPLTFLKEASKLFRYAYSMIRVTA